MRVEGSVVVANVQLGGFCVGTAAIVAAERGLRARGVRDAAVERTL
jgi:hypothetical protein